MIRRLVEEHGARVKDQRYGPRYNPAATYHDARNEAVRRGDRTIGTEHFVLALLVDPASPAAGAIGCDLDTARRALDVLDTEALAAIGIDSGITAGPVAVRSDGRLRLTPAAKGRPDRPPRRAPGRPARPGKGPRGAPRPPPPRPGGRAPGVAGGRSPAGRGAVRVPRPGGSDRDRRRGPAPPHYAQLDVGRVLWPGAFRCGHVHSVPWHQRSVALVRASLSPR